MLKKEKKNTNSVRKMVQTVLSSFKQGRKRCNNVVCLLIPHTNKSVYQNVGGMEKTFKSCEVPK